MLSSDWSIPTAITRFTRETALSVICHQYMRPHRLTMMRMMMMRLMTLETRSKPMRMKVTMKIAASDMPRDLSVSLTFVMRSLVSH